MAEIGSVKATFTASASGLIGAIDQINGKFGAFAAAQKRVASDTAAYNARVKELAAELQGGRMSVEDYSTAVGKLQMRFRSVGEVERMKEATVALSAAEAAGVIDAEKLDAAYAEITASIRGATPALERLSNDLAKNRQDFLDGSISAEQYRAAIETLPGQINGVETATARMSRIFKEAQETVRGLQPPAAALELQLAALKEQFDAGYISDLQYAEATARVQEKMAALAPEAQSLAALMKRGEQVTREFESASDSYARKVQELDELWAVGAISAETYTAAIAKQNAALAASRGGGGAEKAAAPGQGSGEAGGALTLVKQLPGPVGQAVAAVESLKKKASDLAGMFGGPVKTSLQTAFSGASAAMTALFSSTTVTGLMTSITALGPALVSAFAAGAAAIAPIVVTAAAIAAAVYSVVKLTEGFVGALSGGKDVLGPIVEGVKTVASFLAEHIGRALVAIGAILGNVVKWVADWTGLSSALVAVTEVVKGAFILIGEGVAYIVKQLEYWAGIEVKPPEANVDTSGLDGAADAAAAAKAAMEEEAAAIKSVNDAIAQQERALSSAIDAAAGLGQQGFDAAVAYQTELRALNDQLQAGILNETSYAQAAGKAKAEFDSQVAAIKERNKAVADINAEIEKSATAGKNLGAAADGVRAQFKTVADNIRRELESGVIGPEEAKKRMAAAVDAMNGELGRLGDDMKFAERIRDQMKTAGQKVAEELAAIDANQTLTADEKLKAKAQVKEKAAAGLPGGGGDDPISKFREQQKALNDALRNGVIGQQEFNQRQATIRSELDASVADFRDQQGRNAGPDRRANTAADVNSSEGVATFFRILRGSDDPTAKQIAEAQRQTRLLERVNEALADNRPVQI